MRIMDADALISKYIDTDIEKFSNSDVKIVLENLKQNILKAPSIDIVRCGECKHNYNTAINHGKMQPKCDFTDYKLTENDFCSRGEREGE